MFIFSCPRPTKYDVCRACLSKSIGPPGLSTPQPDKWWERQTAVKTGMQCRNQIGGGGAPSSSSFLLLPSEPPIGRNFPLSQIISRKVRTIDSPRREQHTRVPILPRYAIHNRDPRQSDFWTYKRKLSRDTPDSHQGLNLPKTGLAWGEPLSVTQTPSHRITTRPPPTISPTLAATQSQHDPAINPPKTQILSFPVRIVHTYLHPSSQRQAPTDTLPVPPQIAGIIANPPLPISNHTRQPKVGR
jgi:hypothetical protein